MSQNLKPIIHLVAEKVRELVRQGVVGKQDRQGSHQGGKADSNRAGQDNIKKKNSSLDIWGQSPLFEIGQMEIHQNEYIQEAMQQNGPKQAFAGDESHAVKQAGEERQKNQRGTTKQVGQGK